LGDFQSSATDFSQTPTSFGEVPVRGLSESVLDVWKAISLDSRREEEEGTTFGLALPDRDEEGRSSKARPEPKLVCLGVGKSSCCIYSFLQLMCISRSGSSGEKSRKKAKMPCPMEQKPPKHKRPPQQRRRRRIQRTNSFLCPVIMLLLTPLALYVKSLLRNLTMTP
jgi:hypothetical protein